MILGLSGTFASGKDTLAHHLVQKYDFLHVSTGDMIRAVAEAQRGSTERPVLLEVANQLREKRGPGVLAELAIEKLANEKDKYQHLVISGVRSLGEARTIKEAGGKIIFIDAPMEIRYKRIQARHRASEEQLTFEQFKASEEMEEHAVHDNPYIQDITGVKELADIEILNQDNVVEYLAEAEHKLNL